MGKELNKIRWYPFSEMSKVLFINFEKEDIKIFDKFNVKGEFLNSVDGDLILSKIKKELYSTIIIFSKFESIIEKNEKFIKKIADIINGNTELIIFVNNILSINNILSVSQEQKKGILYDNLKRMLDSVDGNISYKFFYPMLNDECINVIYTDDFLPIHGGLDKIINLTDNRYLYDLKQKIVDLCYTEPNAYKHITNSFMIIVNAEEKIKNYKFISYQNLRKKDYSMMTIIKDNYVEKQSLSENMQHLNDMRKIIILLNERNIKLLDKYENNKIISRFIDNHVTFDEELRTLDINKADCYKLLDQFFGLNFSSFFCEYDEKNVFTKYNINVKNRNIEQLTYLDYGVYDMIFQNCFCIDNEYYFFDQEWMEEIVPLEFVVFRNYLYTDSIKNIISLEELSKHYHFESFIDLFWELENALQQKINDETVYNDIINNKTIYQQNKENEIKIRDLNQLLENQKELIDKQDMYIKHLEETEKYLRIIEEEYNKSSRKKIKDLKNKIFTSK